MPTVIPAEKKNNSKLKGGKHSAHWKDKKSCEINDLCAVLQFMSFLRWIALAILRSFFKSSSFNEHKIDPSIVHSSKKITCHC